MDVTKLQTPEGALEHIAKIAIESYNDKISLSKAQNQLLAMKEMNRIHRYMLDKDRMNQRFAVAD